MKVGVILVGTELLNGGTLDTNSLYIAEELNKYGMEIEFKITVRDFKEEIYRAIDYCKKYVDLIIMSGGLGPTLDDITKEVIADYVKKPLVVDEEELKELKDKFEKAGLKFKNLNIKEVEKPEGSVTFKNDVGMAPAVYIDDIVAFPGVPKELYNMLPKFLTWYAKEKKLLDDEIYIKELITYGMAESLLDEAVREFFTEEGIYYEFLVKDYGILIRLQSKMSNKNKVEKIVKKIYNRIGEFIFGEDKDRLEKKARKDWVEKLVEQAPEDCKLIVLKGAYTPYESNKKKFEESISHKEPASIMLSGVSPIWIAFNPQEAYDTEYWLMDKATTVVQCIS